MHSPFSLRGGDLFGCVKNKIWLQQFNQRERFRSFDQNLYFPTMSAETIAKKLLSVLRKNLILQRYRETSNS
ncbi:hypothetical protein [uncultured Cohaesibacter sp.]|uniref:hypothetical protein n=1 Tax=uncultured Cohaesibacter sp. TaxID=1002546 RepID=UPI0029C747E0|nr:hypothetical protein [uncultured Cohaesibacter sp.]